MVLSVTPSKAGQQRRQVGVHFGFFKVRDGVVFFRGNVITNVMIAMAQVKRTITLVWLFDASLSLTTVSVSSRVASLPLH